MNIDGRFRRPISMDELKKINTLIEGIADREGITVASLLGCRRSYDLIPPRVEIAKELRSWMDNGKHRFSLPEIGAIMGGRHHTSILHYLRMEIAQEEDFA